MHDTNLVSVVIPSKNRPDLVRRAVESVYRQTYRPIELLIIDDGSDTPITLEGHYQQKNDFTLRVLRNQMSAGVANARNRGILESRGRWVAFLDDDDLWLEDKLKIQVEALQGASGPYRGASCQIILQNNETEEVGKRTHRATRREIIDALLYADDNVTPSSLIFERSVFNDVGLFHADFPTAEDREWLLRYLMGHELLMVDHYLARFTEHSNDRLTRDHALMAAGEKRFLSFIRDNAKRLGGNSRWALGYRHAKVGHETLLAGKYWQGLGYYLKAVLIYPLELRSIAGLMAALTGRGNYRRIVSMRMARLRD